MAEKGADAIVQTLVEQVLESATGFVDERFLAVKNVGHEAFGQSVASNAVSGLFLSFVSQADLPLYNLDVFRGNERLHVLIVPDDNGVARVLFVLDQFDPEAFENLFGPIGQSHRLSCPFSGVFVLIFFPERSRSGNTDTG
jgi:hypothetical protein